MNARKLLLNSTAARCTTGTYNPQAQAAAATYRNTTIHLCIKTAFQTKDCSLRIDIVKFYF